MAEYGYHSTSVRRNGCPIAFLLLVAKKKRQQKQRVTKKQHGWMLLFLAVFAC
jgi:hypothetical protein